MDKSALLFNNITVNKSLVEEIFAFDCSKLDVTDGSVIAKYTLALSQYLIYLQLEINKTKVAKRGKQRFLDACVAMSLDKDILKRFKTKGDAVNYIVKMDPTLDRTQLEADVLQDELTLVEGLDKTITELITTFKRELTRRENELYITRKERYSK
jgi:hypothetical protein